MEDAKTLKQLAATIQKHHVQQGPDGAHKFQARQDAERRVTQAMRAQKAAEHERALAERKRQPADPMRRDHAPDGATEQRMQRLEEHVHKLSRAVEQLLRDRGPGPAGDREPARRRPPAEAQMPGKVRREERKAPRKVVEIEEIEIEEVEAPATPVEPVERKEPRDVVPGTVR
jgi:hypothetical protein